jgi:hypothetical protein
MTLQKRLVDIVGAAHVLTAPADTKPYFTDWRKQYTAAAECVVRPATTQEVSQVVALCAREAVAVVPQGGNTGLVGGSIMLGQPAFGQGFDCKESPEPDRPGTGLVGSLDPPRASGGVEGSVYREVGYAGLVWHNYDIGCAGAALNPSTTTDTWLGNQALNVAKFVVGGVNWAHYLIADGGELLSPLDQLISDGTRAMYDAVFTTFVGPVLLLLAVILLVLALRGDLARQTQRAALAVVALVVGSAAYLAPVD